MRLINNMIKAIYKSIQNLKYINALTHSYSQSAEDIIIRRILNRMGVRKITYIDIGCNHPIELNNTYLAYKNGGQGVLADANPDLSKIISRKRKRDKFVNTGIAAKSTEKMIFYTLSYSVLSTFDKKLAEKIISNGKIKILNEQKVPVIGINDFLKIYFNKKTDFVSLDVEGFDAEIIHEWDFTKYKPAVFCVETISNPAEGKKQTKISDIIEVFKRENYIVYADTYINTIFVDKQKWLNR